MVQFVVRWLARVTVNVCTKYEVSIFGHSKDIKGVPKFRKWSRDLSHAPLGVKFSYSDKGLHGMPTKFEVHSFIHSKVMDGVPNFKFRSRDLDHAHFRGQFVVHWLVHVMISVCTKYEIWNNVLV